MKLNVHACGPGDVFRHLAVEDMLLSENASDRIDLLFYRCAPCVVLGKNQNPWRECQPGRLAARGVAVARRMSGGGAVYHDPGNLNVSLLLPRARYETGLVMRVFLDALGSLGIWAACPERSRLVWNDAKISGQAFAYRRDRVLHHGTLLLSADLAALQDALRPCDGVFDTAAVASKPSPVANLPAGEEDIMRAVAAAAGRLFGAEPRFLPAPTVLFPMGQEWSWVYGRTPDFTWQRFLPGERGTVRLTVTEGRLVGWTGGDIAGIDLPGKGVALAESEWRAFLQTHPGPVRQRLEPLFPDGVLPP